MFNDVKELIAFIESLKRSHKKESLDYMKQLCAYFGNPQERTNYIHIGGTNGKGSTITFLKNILMDGGYNVGSFISPYVICFNERISINNDYITDEDLLSYGNLIINEFPELQKRGIRHPSFFEFITLLAFLYFADQKNLDFAICEVGIGGKLDSTNVINPLISAVTNVSYDHRQILGNTLPEIWENKLGIVKKDTKFITFENQEFAEMIQKTCETQNAELIFIDRYKITNINLSIEKTSFTYRNFPNLTLQLLGTHQVENAVLALEIAQNLPQISLTCENIYRGLRKATWPGRIEKINSAPLILIDGAHNIDGITKLKNFLEIIKDRFLRIVFAVSSNKDKEAMIKIIEEIADEIIFTSFSYQRKEESFNLMQMSSHHNKKQIDNLDTIIEIALADEKVITVFCGSLFLISEIRSKFIRG